MIQAIITVFKQVSPDDWDKYSYTKSFEETSTIQEIDDWAKTHDVSILEVTFVTNDDIIKG